MDREWTDSGDTCADAGAVLGAVVGALLPVVAVGTVQAQTARVPRVTDTLPVTEASPLPLTATEAPTHTPGS